MFHRLNLITATAALGLTSMTLASTPGPHDLQLFQSYPGLQLHHSKDGRIARVWGKSFSEGSSPKESADAFLEQHSLIWGVEPDELAPVGRYEDGRHLQPIMPLRDGAGAIAGYKFTGVCYTQHAGRYPVWRTSLILLARNTTDHQLVLASSDLRDLGDFEPVNLSAQYTSIENASRIARGLMGPDAIVERTPGVGVFAGVDNDPAEPTMAIIFEARVGTNADGNAYQRMLYVVDPLSNTVLHQENRILNCMAAHAGQQAATTISQMAPGSVTGTVQAFAGDGYSAEECDPEATIRLPYALVNVDGLSAYADINGDFSIDGNVGSGATLTAAVDGRYFLVNNQAQADTEVVYSVDDGDDVNIQHNKDATEFTFAEVDTYIAANDVREVILQSNPDFPTIANQVNWPINVNLSDTCNAYYDYSSINFFSSGGGCNNTAFGTITYHEYGHHMIACAGSGQNEYGEGQSDVLSLVMTFDPILAKGFFLGNCTSGIRNADNSCQFLNSGCSTCGSAIHSCGQLISGCVYDTYLQLSNSSPFTAVQTIRDLAINSTLVHTGTSIDPSVTIDYLTLDDDDGDIGNGTPNYNEIAGGFGLHDMDAPQLDWLSMSLSEGVPSYVTPSGGDEIRLSIEDSIGSYQAGSAKVYINVDGIYDISTLTDAGNGEYVGNFPATTCGAEVPFWFSAKTADGITQVLPEGAPGVQYSTVSASSEPNIAFSDDCTTDPGWTVSGGATDGFWERGIPAGGGNRPQTDCDVNASFCWITENTSSGGGDVDGGETILTSPQIDATDVSSVSFCYWYRNIGGGSNVEDDVFLVDISDDNGASWTNILTVGPIGPGTTGEWSTEELFFADFPEFEANERFRIRFNASDLNETSRVEAAIDNIVMGSIPCDPDEPGCDGDADGDGDADVNDMLYLLSVWGSADPDGDLDGNGGVDVNDILLLLSVYGNC